MISVFRHATINCSYNLIKTLIHFFLLQLNLNKNKKINNLINNKKNNYSNKYLKNNNNNITSLFVIIFLPHLMNILKNYFQSCKNHKI